MQREIMSDLMRWKNTPNHKPLIINGVRQCGKTYIIKEFGDGCYDDTAYFNFEDDDISMLFEHDLKIDRIVAKLGIRRNKPIDTGTLIIFDEIQNCPRAITSLKYFCEDGKYDVICAGSLLGIKLAESSPPVGKVDMLTMYPMSFREYLVANGDSLLVEAVDKDPLDPDIEFFKDRLTDRYLEYMAIGGLPEIVSTWIDTRDTGRIDSMLRALKDLYISDIERYGRGNVRRNGELVWRSIPSQLSKDNKRFIFGHVSEGCRARDLWPSVDWLSKAGLVHLVPVSVGNDIPPSFESDPSIFKLYCFDTGILRILAELPIDTILRNDDRFTFFKGACTENFILLELLKMTDTGIYFWRSGNRAEVDFLTWIDGRLTPVEVKSGCKVSAKSLGVYMDSHDCIGAVMSMKGSSVGERIVNVPLYAAWTLGKMIRIAYDDGNKHRGLVATCSR